MRSITKLFAGIAAAAVMAASMSVSVFAEDIDFDMAKAHWTAGGSTNGASSYTCGTRLSNERRDNKNFNPTWMTPQSEVIVTYQVRENKDSDTILTDEDTSKLSAPPAEFILQTWKGDLVDSQEDRMQHILPSTWTATSCTFTYGDLVAAWGSADFSTVYAVQVSDNSVNPLMVTSMMITNCDIPEEDIAEGIKLGTILKDGQEVVVTTAATETTEAIDTSVDSPDADQESSISDKQDEESAESKVSENENEEKDSSNVTLIIVIAAFAVVIGVAACIIIKKVSNRNKGWH